MKKLKGLSAEMVVALGATFVSLCALTVSIIETNIMYEQRQEERTYQRANVWPSLAFRPDRDNSLHRFYLVNNGVGPAIIKSFNISVGGKTVDSWEEAINSMYGSTDVLKQSFGIANGMVHPAGKIIPLMTVESEGFYAHPTELRVSVCYCSVYEDCWVQHVFGVAKKIEQCPIVSEKK